MPLVATTHTLSVHLIKPKLRNRRRRIFMGVSWKLDRPDSAVGVQICSTFLRMPTGGRLIGGDVILKVCGAPVNTPEDVVFHWHHAPAGEVEFEVLRSETHCFSVHCNALREFQVTWTDVSAPIVASTSASDERLRALQQPGFPLAGDVILAIGGRATPTQSEASALLQSACPDEVVDIAVLRGAPEPVADGHQADDSCCFGTATRVQRPKRGAAGQLLDAERSRGTSLTDMRDVLLLDGGGLDPEA